MVGTVQCTPTAAGRGWRASWRHQSPQRERPGHPSQSITTRGMCGAHKQYIHIYMYCTSLRLEQEEK